MKFLHLLHEYNNNNTNKKAPDIWSQPKTQICPIFAQKRSEKGWLFESILVFKTLTWGDNY